MTKKKIIIAGASGMIGGIILRSAMMSDDISQIVSLVRKPSGITHHKLKEIILQNFTNYSEIQEQLKDFDAAYFCIGVYTGSVPDDQFKMITVDYAKAFIDVIKEQSPHANFCFLSGAGADLNEKSRLSFARYKGMAENYLIQKQFKYWYIFRPAYIYPVEKRLEPNFSYRIMRTLYPIIKIIYPQGAITSEVLANAMFKAGICGNDHLILENQDIKTLHFS
ncbi:MAG: NAD(P)H-binding protein [Saprospiraceae bacterium]|nr:NAD(P)H-binding protein [Candidatus Defluviibacterium haderslevense]MBK7245052.1 NAD(P)H-binding protein [Candidatus Defluviibacterium haderslevense]